MNYDENEKLKLLIKKAIWTIECLVEEYEDDEQETIDFLKELKEVIK
jgi:hypothetical protein